MPGDLAIPHRAARVLSRLGAVLGRAGRLLEALTALALATIAIRTLPGPRVSGLLGSLTEEGDPELTAAQLRVALHTGVRVRHLAAAVPFDAKCLAQATATRWLLRRRGIPVRSHLGVLSTAPFEAHAWVTAGGRILVGGGVEATELARFS